jgi:transposase-like protein
MGQVLHGCATTTEAIRRAIQNSQESLRALSKRYGINPKTVAKWRKRGTVADLKTGPKEPTSTSLSPEDEAIIVAFRKHTLLPLDDCLYALQATIPHLTAHLFIAAFSVTPSHGCRMWRTAKASNASSRPIQSAISIST